MNLLAGGGPERAERPDAAGTAAVGLACEMWYVSRRIERGQRFVRPSSYLVSSVTRHPVAAITAASSLGCLSRCI